MMVAMKTMNNIILGWKCCFILTDGIIGKVIDTNLGDFTQYRNFIISSLIFTGSENVTNGT
jgi:hypothetical protein